MQISFERFGNAHGAIANTACCTPRFTQRHSRSITSLRDNMEAKQNFRTWPWPVHCNRFKGPKVAGLDTATNEVVRLFHPRRDRWTEHFAWNGPELKALTPVGRVTIAVLAINEPEFVDVRKALHAEGVFWRL
jgi:hypothetical protein